MFRVHVSPLWRGERLPTPVCWPGEFHGVPGIPWGSKESDSAKQLSLSSVDRAYNGIPITGSMNMKFRRKARRTVA